VATAPLTVHALAMAPAAVFLIDQEPLRVAAARPRTDHALARVALAPLRTDQAPPMAVETRVAPATAAVSSASQSTRASTLATGAGSAKNSPRRMAPAGPLSHASAPPRSPAGKSRCESRTLMAYPCAILPPPRSVPDDVVDGTTVNCRHEPFGTPGKPSCAQS